MPADVLRNFGIDIVRIRRLIPVAGLAQSVGAGTLCHLDAGIVDLRQIAEVRRVPRVTGPELFQIGGIELTAGDSERIVDGVIGAANIEDRAGVQRVDRVSRKAQRVPLRAVQRKRGEPPVKSSATVKVRNWL